MIYIQANVKNTYKTKKTQIHDTNTHTNTFIRKHIQIIRIKKKFRKILT